MTALLVGAVLSVIATGCGTSSVENRPPPDYRKALEGAPPRLAELYSEGDQLIPGGKTGFEKRLKSLRGFPVVVNLWASWCGGCRFEFPDFQQMSARFGTRVAFIGVDSDDSDGQARAWLHGTPVPYPSYSDPDHELADSYKVLGMPDTAIYSRSGELVWLKQGNFRDATELEEAVRRYALGRS